MTTASVQYQYANGSANTIRPTRTVYPNGRVLNFDYGTTGGQDDRLSRVASLIDHYGTTHLVDASYLGLGTPVITDYTQPNVRYTLVGTAGGNDPDTGDIYRGLDRFGRVKDAYWYDYGAGADAARIQYGYDRAGNRNNEGRQKPIPVRRRLTDGRKAAMALGNAWLRFGGRERPDHSLARSAAQGEALPPVWNCGNCRVGRGFESQHCATTYGGTRKASSHPTSNRRWPGTGRPTDDVPVATNREFRLGDA